MEVIVVTPDRPYSMDLPVVKGNQRYHRVLVKQTDELRRPLTIILGVEARTADFLPIFAQRPDVHFKSTLMGSTPSARLIFPIPNFRESV